MNFPGSGARSRELRGESFLPTLGVVAFTGGLGLFLIPYRWSSVGGRILIGFSFMLALGELAARLTGAQLKWLRSTTLFLASLLLAALIVLLTGDLMPERRTEVLLDLSRQIFLFCAGAALLLHLRSERARRSFASAMTAIGLSCSSV